MHESAGLSATSTVRSSKPRSRRSLIVRRDLRVAGMRVAVRSKAGIQFGRSYVRVATWNLEQRSGQGRKGLAQAKLIHDTPADVWCLTEAGLASLPLAFKTAHSAPMLGVKGAVYFAIVAAADLEPIDLSEVPTAAAAVVHTSVDDWLVVAICMPWRFDAPALPVDAAPGVNTGPDQWEHVLEQLNTAVVRLRLSWPESPLVIAGDFNQTLTDLIVGSRNGRTQLDQFLARHRLSAFTAAAHSIKDGCASVDHICGPAATSTVTIFPAKEEISASGQVSDHLGYSVDVVSDRGKMNAR
jgi:hypothetical protein